MLVSFLLLLSLFAFLVNAQEDYKAFLRGKESTRISANGRIGRTYRILTDTTTNEVFFQKSFSLVYDKHSCEHEITVLKQLPEHPSIANLVLSWKDDFECHIVTRSMRNAKTLEVALRDGSFGTEREFGQEVWQFSTRLRQVMLMLHKNGVIHNDLKTSNILFDKDTGSIMLIDFDMAVWIDFENEEPRHNLFGGTKGFCHSFLQDLMDNRGHAEEAQNVFFSGRQDEVGFGAILISILNAGNPSFDWGSPLIYECVEQNGICIFSNHLPRENAYLGTGHLRSLIYGLLFQENAFSINQSAISDHPFWTESTNGSSIKKNLEKREFNQRTQFQDSGSSVPAKSIIGSFLSFALVFYSAFL